MGNIYIQRDWGWAPEYVEAMWLMLQQDQPEDFVVATGESHSLEKFVEAAFACVDLDWNDHVVVDPNLLRPTDHMMSRGDPVKARERLNWQAQHKMKEVVQLMVRNEQREKRTYKQVL